MSEITPTNHFEEQLGKNWPADSWKDVGVVVAVSGGADSVALLRGLHALKTSQTGRGQLSAAHFNHGLRPEADADEAWVSQLCEGLGIPLTLGKSDVALAAEQQGDGLEAAARSARLAFFEETADAIGARFIATAHTLNDQEETILFRILRGTGLSGLRGIARTRPLSRATTLIRPMLGHSRQMVCEYLELLGQSWLEDATNTDTQFTRNRIRHELLPGLRNEYNPKVDEALLRLSHHASSAVDFLEASAEELLARSVQFQLAEPIFQQNPSKIAACQELNMNATKLAKEHELLIAEVCRIAWRKAGWPEQAMTERHWKLLVAMICGEEITCKHIFPSVIVCERIGDVVKLIYSQFSHND